MAGYGEELDVILIRMAMVPVKQVTVEAVSNAAVQDNHLLPLLNLPLDKLISMMLVLLKASICQLLLNHFQGKETVAVQVVTVI